jgi:hypothetical protein
MPKDSIDNIDYAPEKCGLCSGTGRYGGICTACEGQGSVLVAQPPMKCGLCSGTGRYGGICTACKGTGWAHAIPDPTIKNVS